MIQEIAVGAGGAASVDFTSIPGSYRHLEFWVLVKSEGVAGDLMVRFNNDSGANYGTEAFRGTAAAASAATASGQTSGNVFSLPATGDASWASGKIIVPYYETGTVPRQAIGTYGASISGGNSTGMYTAFWTGTAAITRITFLHSTGPGSVDIADGSAISLYGIT